MIEEYLQQLGLDQKEQKIYMALAAIGVQPASVVAKQCSFDRVTTYKHLKKLGEQGFVKIYYKDGIQCFGIESFDAIETYLQNKTEHLQSLVDNLPTAMNILKSLKGDEDILPKLQLFEGDSGVQSLCRDILFEVQSQSISQIRILNSNTFEDTLHDISLKKNMRDFFESLGAKNIDVELFKATGGLVPEHLSILGFRDIDLENLPIAIGTTNVFIVGSIVYVASYKHSKIGLKISQKELSQIFHFLFDLFKRQSAQIKELTTSKE